jgi:hypothetical protein
MPTCSQYPSSSAQNHRQHTRARHLPRLRNRTRAALRTEPLHQRYNPIHDNPPACSLTTIQPCPVPSRRHHCALPLYTTLTHLPAPLTTQRMASWTSTAANTAHPHTHHDPNSVIPPYPTTPTPGQSAYATPHHYPPQPQPQPQPQQSYFPAPIPRQVQAQTQMQPQPQTQTHVQPYPQNPPVLYRTSPRITTAQTDTTTTTTTTSVIRCGGTRRRGPKEGGAETRTGHSRGGQHWARVSWRPWDGWGECWGVRGGRTWFLPVRR